MHIYIGVGAIMVETNFLLRIDYRFKQCNNWLLCG